MSETAEMQKALHLTAQQFIIRQIANCELELRLQTCLESAKSVAPVQGAVMVLFRGQRSPQRQH